MSSTGLPTEEAEGTTLGTCSWCGKSDVTIYTDNGRCEYCDVDIVRCGICKTDEHRDSFCRHLNLDPDTGELYGSGYNSDGSDDIRDSLFLLFDLMPGGFAVDLAKAIRGRQFFTFLSAPLIGSGGLLEINGMPDREGVRRFFGWGDAMMEIGQGEKAEETAIAYGWLSSLYMRATEKANRTTLQWISEYLNREKERRAAGRGELR